MEFLLRMILGIRLLGCLLYYVSVVHSLVFTAFGGSDAQTGIKTR